MALVDEDLADRIPCMGLSEEADCGLEISRLAAERAGETPEELDGIVEETKGLVEKNT